MLLLTIPSVFKSFVDVDKTKACDIKLYGTTSYGIMCVDPVRAVGTEIYYLNYFLLFQHYIFSRNFFVFLDRSS